MGKDRMDVPVLLRKEESEADLDFLREGLRMVMQAVMDADVVNKTRGTGRAQPRAADPRQWLSGWAVGHAGEHTGSEHPQGAGGQLLPLSDRTAQAQ